MEIQINFWDQILDLIQILFLKINAQLVIILIKDYYFYVNQLIKILIFNFIIN